MYQALGFLIVIPSGFQIVIVDEKFERFNTTVFCIIFTGGSYNNTNIIFTTQVILPVEIIGSVSTGIRCRLQDIETFTVVATTWNSFVHYIPSSHVTTSSFHHSFNPIVHCPSKRFFFLFGSKRNSVTFSNYLQFDIIKIIFISRCIGRAYIQVPCKSLHVSLRRKGSVNSNSFFKVLPFRSETNSTPTIIMNISSRGSMSLRLRIIGCICTIIERDTYNIIFHQRTVSIQKELSIPTVCSSTSRSNNESTTTVFTYSINNIASSISSSHMSRNKIGSFTALRITISNDVS